MADAQVPAQAAVPADKELLQATEAAVTNPQQNPALLHIYFLLYFFFYSFSVAACSTRHLIPLFVLVSVLFPRHSFVLHFCPFCSIPFIFVMLASPHNPQVLCSAFSLGPHLVCSLFFLLCALRASPGNQRSFNVSSSAVFVVRCPQLLYMVCW